MESIKVTTEIRQSGSKKHRDEKANVVFYVNNTAFYRLCVGASGGALRLHYKER